MNSMSEHIKSGSHDLHTGQTIRTFKGHYIDVFDPNPATIDIEDIAHALANTCRFGGHTFVHYSVALHSIRVAEHEKITAQGGQMELTALLHDATEAYMCDIPRPIKRRLVGYKQAEDNLMAVIANKFGLIYPFPPVIKEVDTLMLEFEHKHIVIQRELALCRPIVHCEIEFLKAFKRLTQ